MCWVRKLAEGSAGWGLCGQGGEGVGGRRSGGGGGRWFHKECRWCGLAGCWGKSGVSGGYFSWFWITFFFLWYCE